MLAAGDTETVTVFEPGRRTRFGDREPDLTVGVQVPGCLFAPVGSSESSDGARQVDTHAQLYAPLDSPIRSTSQVVARGDRYEVVGNPQVWAGESMVISLRLVTG